MDENEHILRNNGSDDTPAYEGWFYYANKSGRNIRVKFNDKQNENTFYFKSK